MVQNTVRTRTLRQGRIRPSLLAAVCLLFLLLSAPAAGPKAKAEETFPYDAIRDALTGTLNEEAGEFSAAAFTILGSEKAGSQPRTVLPCTGGCIRSWVRFVPNTVIALSSALSVRLLRSSVSMEGAIRRLYASEIASSR